MAAKYGREEVEKLVNDFMAGEKGNKMRQKIVELKKKAEEATTPSGCSFMNLDFIKEEPIKAVEKSRVPSCNS
ncbi:hypothetical protein JHK87_042577 [Glycine soja]|nr:hypothetical protein JHK87_042577 [Glycine soja]